MTMIGCCSCSCTKHYELKRDGEDWRTLSNVTFTSGKEGVNTLEPGHEIQFNIEIPCSNYTLLVDIESADYWQNIDHSVGVSGLSVRAGECNQVWHNVTYATDAEIDDWQTGVSGSAWTYHAGPAIFYSQPYSGGNFTFSLTEVDTETGAYGLVGGSTYDPTISTPNFVTDRPDLLYHREVNGVIKPFPAGVRTIPVTFRSHSDRVVINKVSVWCGPAHSLLGENYVDSISPYKEQFHVNYSPTTTITDNGVNTSVSLPYVNSTADDTLTIDMTVDNTYLVDGVTSHNWITKYDPLLPHRRRAVNTFAEVLSGEENVTIDETVSDATTGQIADLDSLSDDIAYSVYTSGHTFEYEDPNVFFFLEPYADCTWSATYSSANSCAPINYLNTVWDLHTGHTETRPVSLGPLDLNSFWGYPATGVSCAGGWTVDADKFEDGFTSDWLDFGSPERDERKFQFTRGCTEVSGGKAAWLLPLTAEYTEAFYSQGYHARRYMSEKVASSAATLSIDYTPSSGNWESSTEWTATRVENYLDTNLNTTMFTHTSACSWIYDDPLDATESWYDYGSPTPTSVVVNATNGIPRLKDNSLTIETATIDGTEYTNMVSYFDGTEDCTVAPYDSYVQQKEVTMHGDPSGCTSYSARTTYTNSRNLMWMSDGIGNSDDFHIGFAGPLWDFPNLDAIVPSSTMGSGVFDVRTFDATPLWELINTDTREKLKARTVTLTGLTDTDDTMTITLRH